MASLGQQGGDESDDGMDEFMDRFRTEKYKNAFNESNWEEVRMLYIFSHVPFFCNRQPVSGLNLEFSKLVNELTVSR